MAVAPAARGQVMEAPAAPAPAARGQVMEVPAAAAPAAAAAAPAAAAPLGSILGPTVNFAGILRFDPVICNKREFITRVQGDRRSRLWHPRIAASAPVLTTSEGVSRILAYATFCRRFADIIGGEAGLVERYKLPNPAAPSVVMADEWFVPMDLFHIALRQDLTAQFSKPQYELDPADVTSLVETAMGFFSYETVEDGEKLTAIVVSIPTLL